MCHLHLQPFIVSRLQHTPIDSALHVSQPPRVRDLAAEEPDNPAFTCTPLPGTESVLDPEEVDTVVPVAPSKKPNLVQKTTSEMFVSVVPPPKKAADSNPVGRFSRGPPPSVSSPDSHYRSPVTGQ